MKRIISVFGIICMLVFLCMSAFAGDIPEAFSYDDDAKVFIGTLLNFSNSPLGNSSGEKEVTVRPVLKIKGDIEIGSDDSYERCYFGKSEPKEGVEYFFGWLSNTEVYAYEIKERTEDKIILQITDEFSERIQNYLDEGLYQRSEIERMNVGRKITLSEYMETSRELAEKVTVSLNGVEYDINVDEFYEFSDNALITDVKNNILKRMGSEDWEEDILYITVTHRQDTLYDGFSKTAYACITRFCEVDRYHPMMGRLPNCDFTMKWEDLASLYEFLPGHVQKELYAKNMGETDPNSSAPVPALLIAFGVVAVLGIAGCIRYQKKK